LQLAASAPELVDLIRRQEAGSADQVIEPMPLDELGRGRLPELTRSTKKFCHRLCPRAPPVAELSPSRFRFRPPIALTFAFRLRPPRSASIYLRPVLGARARLGVHGSPCKTLPSETCRSLRPKCVRRGREDRAPPHS
jgi:hypothetical protein